MNIDSIINFSNSQADVEHYRPEQEKILSGEPLQRIENHYSSPCKQFDAGIWSGDKGAWKVGYTEHEYCEILDGSSIITDSRGQSMHVNRGDKFVIPAGFEGTWEVLDTCKKIYVVFQQKE
ncbi:cupin domain-containing protein [uncultured Shewanella sp.]|uniref:cupin domain-containing protein n=1 Tax=Shewanella atlantica TaxID=271099 RepID=UPI0026348295|nr:cupin domain-containing protein [uncultured Shewanella sp.]